MPSTTNVSDYPPVGTAPLSPDAIVDALNKGQANIAQVLIQAIQNVTGFPTERTSSCPARREDGLDHERPGERPLPEPSSDLAGAAELLVASITQSPGRSGSDANPADSIEPR